MSISSCLQGSHRWLYLRNVKTISETLNNNWKGQCTNRELLQVQQCSVCDAEKRNVIKMTYS